MDELILAFDCGTQSTRAMLFNDKGQLIDKEKVCFEPYYSSQEGYAEQDPNLYWDVFCEASQKLKARNSDKWASIIGVTVTTMRDVGICVDKDVKPIRPCMIWLDRREVECKKPIPFFSRLLFAVAGMTEAVNKNRRDGKVNWIRENEPHVWEKTYKYLQYSTFLTHRLCGNIVDSVASMIVHLPFDYRKKQWMSKNHFQRCIFEVEQDKLFPLVEPGEVLGFITKDAADATGITEGLPLIAAGSDKGCETIGTGAIYENGASISFGTTATIQITTPKYVEPEAFLPAYPAVYPKMYNPEIIVFRGYWMLTWFVNEFIRKTGGKNAMLDEKSLDKMLPSIPAGSEGLVVLPYWSPSLKKTEARGAMIGFNEQHTLFHIYRAIIEGINYALLEGMRKLEKRAKTKIEYIKVSGGGAQSDEVCQITADMFGIPVRRVQTYETSGLGASICAFVGLKHFDSYDAAIKNMVQDTKEFKPDKTVHAEYEKLFNEIYVRTYPSLKPVYCRMRKLKFNQED
ncbi:MAG TPA: FGGY-family carbohydrate kinase [Clostridia bacterium]|jgi:sugar (pentulose or hexulose) kinase|nr:FGGY-family carbohydrate kinase [Clostridia bacterium]